MLPLLLSAALSVALADAPGDAAAAAPTCEGSPDAWLTSLRAGPDLDLYLCLAASDDARLLLLPAAQEALADDAMDAGERNRVTRALAVHLLQRLDRPLTREEVLALGPGDQRLLRDGVHARRGRRTPSPEHARVFERFDWYQPRDDYSNGLLDAVDRQNLDLLDAPQPPPEPEAAPAADAVGQGEAPAVPRGMCGCASGSVPAGPAAGGLLLLGLALLGRRRRS
ncbi:MAG: YARHG domain-containing protein [Alphaproteobacteria bacterium]|nr:YARHG domain-containing protein [Alphaproteobacteria bacterium]